MQDRLNPVSVYSDLKSLIDEAPDLRSCDLNDPAIQHWLTEACRAVELSEDDPDVVNLDAIQISLAVEDLSSFKREVSAHKIMLILYRAMARVEGKMPAAGMSGAIAYQAQADATLPERGFSHCGVM